MTEELDELRRIAALSEAHTELLQLICELLSRDLNIRHLMGPELEAKVNVFRKKGV
jgi:hypothetical protein